MFAAPLKGFSLRERSTSAFTLVELAIASTIVVVFMCSALTAFTQMNRYANAARLRTLALAAAQQRLDEVLTTDWKVLNPRPSVLTAGTQTENNLPLNNDIFNGGTGLSSPYTGLDVQVNATRTTAITDLTARTVRAIVTVSYTYRSRPYSVSLTTLRAIDTI